MQLFQVACKIVSIRCALDRARVVVACTSACLAALRRSVMTSTGFQEGDQQASHCLWSFATACCVRLPAHICIVEMEREEALNTRCWRASVVVVMQLVPSGGNDAPPVSP